MRKKNSVLLVIFMFAIISCNNYNLERWKNDKKANNNFRSIENTNALLKKIDIEELNPNEIVKLLGTPDKIVRVDDAVYFEYFIENNCEFKDRDCCILTISFFKKSKPNVSITCS